MRGVSIAEDDGDGETGWRRSIWDGLHQKCKMRALKAEQRAPRASVSSGVCVNKMTILVPTALSATRGALVSAWLGAPWGLLVIRARGRMRAAAAAMCGAPRALTPAVSRVPRLPPPPRPARPPPPPSPPPSRSCRPISCFFPLPPRALAASRRTHPTLPHAPRLAAAWRGRRACVCHRTDWNGKRIIMRYHHARGH
jgi:hypothetical protein